MKPEYFDHVSEAELAKIAPYKAVDVTVPISTVLRSRNKGLYNTYNPKYSEVVPGRITTDPFYRYEELLAALADMPNLKFMTARDALNYRPEGDEVVCHIRHDVDGDILTAVEMAAVEAKYNIPTSYYVLHTAHYYGMMLDGEFRRHSTLAGIYKRIEDFGHEVALHTDGLGVYTRYQTDGAQAVSEEIEWLREQGLKITGTVGHGSITSYGANNYDLFSKVRKSDYIPNDAKSLVHKGNWAPIRALDEDKLGLDYEGNDFFWQNHTPIEYFSLLSQNHWIYNQNWYALNERGTDNRRRDRDYFDQDSVIEKIRSLKGPCYAMVVVHPLHYGLRVSDEESPIMDQAEDGERNGLQIRVGKVDGEIEYLSVAELTEKGERDKPLSHMEHTANAMLFIGRENFRAETLGIDAKLSQISAMHLKLGTGLSTGASSLKLGEAGFAMLASLYQKVCATRTPTHIVVGITEADLNEESAAGMAKLVAFCRRDNVTLRGMIEHCDDYAQSVELSRRAQDLFDIDVVNPYKAFKYRWTKNASVTWDSRNEWSAHGHYLAARALVDSLISGAGERAEPMLAYQSGLFQFPQSFRVTDISNLEVQNRRGAVIIENNDPSAVSMGRWLLKPERPGTKITLDVTINGKRSLGRSQLQIKFFGEDGAAEHYVYVLDHALGAVYPAGEKEGSVYYVLNSGDSYTIRLFMPVLKDYVTAQIVFVPRLGDASEGKIAVESIEVIGIREAVEGQTDLKKVPTALEDDMAMAEMEEPAPAPKPAPQPVVAAPLAPTAAVKAQKTVNVVRVHALSYSGTTWLNLVLGSHPDGFALGPPMRAWKKLRPDNFEGACLVHNKDCEFWNSFAQEWNGETNFLAAIANKSGASHIFFDNPQRDFIEEVMEDDALNVIDVRYVRDARAISASKARKLGDAATYYETILPDGWLSPSFHRIPKPSDAPNVIYARYEDAVIKPLTFFPEFMSKLGLEFTPDMLKFWETDHHITSGNVGPIGMTRLHHGQALGNFESRDVYEKQLAESKAAPDKPFNDERWKTQLTREDLFFFDILMGAKNAELGYARDTFTADEITAFATAHATAVAAGTKRPLPQDRIAAYAGLSPEQVTALSTPAPASA